MNCSHNRLLGRGCDICEAEEEATNEQLAQLEENSGLSDIKLGALFLGHGFGRLARHMPLEEVKDVVMNMLNVLTGPDAGPPS